MQEVSQTSVLKSNTAAEGTYVFVAIASLQVSRLATFYSDLFAYLDSSEARVSPSSKSSTYAELQLTGLKLAIFQPSADQVSEFSAAASAGMSLCIEVSDLEGAIAQLTAMGYSPPGNRIYAVHGQEIYAYDPDGNRLILHQAAMSVG